MSAVDRMEFLFKVVSIEHLIANGWAAPASGEYCVVCLSGDAGGNSIRIGIPPERANEFQLGQEFVVRL